MENNQPLKNDLGPAIPPDRVILIVGWLSVGVVAVCSLSLGLMGRGIIKITDPNYITMFGFILGLVPWISVIVSLILLWRRRFFQSFLLVVGGVAAFLLPFQLMLLMK